jgi:hypothetical protein
MDKRTSILIDILYQGLKLIVIQMEARLGCGREGRRLSQRH